MAVRALLRRISLPAINVVLFAVVATLVVVYGPELRWAARELPRYVDGRIGSPEERRIYRRAARLIRDGRALDEARSLLERALEIDPTCEAGFWLAEYHRVTGRPDDALAQYRRYLEIDPTIAAAWLRAAEILTARGDRAAARELLERGRAYFHGNVERYWPYTDESVEARFRDKALDVYQEYRNASERLTREIERLDGAGPES